VKIRSENNLSKELTLPANIHAYEEEEYGGEDGDGNDITHTIRYYSVNKVFLDDKKFLEKIFAEKYKQGGILMLTTSHGSTGQKLKFLINFENFEIFEKY
jgi:hypothetical protein